MKWSCPLFFINTVAICHYNVAIEVAFSIINHLNNITLGPKFVATGAIWQWLNHNKVLQILLQ